MKPSNSISGPKGQIDADFVDQSIPILTDHFPKPDPPENNATLGGSIIICLVRSAERLDRIEQDLIRQMQHTSSIDACTKRLLTELRVTTNRLRGQIAEIERSEDPNLNEVVSVD